MKAFATWSALLAPKFDVELRGSTLRATRRRMLPSRGVFRVFIPRVVAHIGVREGQPVVTVVPDGLGWLALTICLGGLTTELTMDRAHFPREYPPAFVYGLSAFVLLNLLVEVVRSRAAVRRALSGATL